MIPRRFFLLACLLGLALVQGADAYPRYAARYGQDCTLCHVNPSGGGLRNLYATQFITPTELAADWLNFEGIESLDPQLSNSVLIGADLRTLFIAGDDSDAEPENFFHMQSDIYLQLSAGDRYFLYFDRGQSSSLESFATAYVLPYNGYLKLGRFSPAYGWKFVDHNHATREKLDFLPPNHTDVGMEFGLHPGNGALQFSLMNGSRGNVLDTDAALAYLGRGEYRFQLAGVGLAVGGSGSYQDFVGSKRIVYGPFGYLHWGRFTWVGELDLANSDLDDGPTTTQLLTSHELSYTMFRGVDFLAGYDFEDPDLDFLTGSRTRWIFGVDTLLSPFFGVRATWTVYSTERGDDVGEVDLAQLEALVRFLY